MIPLVSTIDWGALSYQNARDLPMVLADIERAKKWDPGALGQTSGQWDEIAASTYGEGNVPDAAYAVIPCLVEMAVSQPHRTDEERCLVISTTVDTVVGGYKGSAGVPSRLYAVFNRGIQQARSLALALHTAELPAGLRLNVVAGRLLAPATLVAANPFKVTPCGNLPKLGCGVTNL